MSDLPTRPLSALALTLEVTAHAHAATSLLLIAEGGMSKSAAALAELGEQMLITAEQIRAGRYGDPERIHD